LPGEDFTLADQCYPVVTINEYLFGVQEKARIPRMGMRTLRVQDSRNFGVWTLACDLIVSRALHLEIKLIIVAGYECLRIQKPEVHCTFISLMVSPKVAFHEYSTNARIHEFEW
jgi:hypothetical protein